MPASPAYSGDRERAHRPRPRRRGAGVAAARGDDGRSGPVHAGPRRDSPGGVPAARDRLLQLPARRRARARGLAVGRPLGRPDAEGLLARLPAGDRSSRPPAPSTAVRSRAAGRAPTSCRRTCRPGSTARRSRTRCGSTCPGVPPRTTSARSPTASSGTAPTSRTTSDTSWSNVSVARRRPTRTRCARSTPPATSATHPRRSR